MKIIGHRGAKGLAPENTLASIRKALEYPVDAIEIDVRVTADGVVVLEHDRRLTDPAGNKLLISTQPFAALQAHKADLTTLTEAIEAINRRVPLIIEIKAGEPLDPIVAVVKGFVKRGWSAADLQFLSFDYRLVQQLIPILPGFTIVLNEWWSMWRLLHRAKRLGIRDIGFWRLLVFPYLIRYATKRGFRLYSVQSDPRTARRWAKAGIYGIAVDFPDRFAPAPPRKSSSDQ